jgi:hypothetical protein
MTIVDVDTLARHAGEAESPQGDRPGSRNASQALLADRGFDRPAGAIVR